jgi:hypothetical protein
VFKEITGVPLNGSVGKHEEKQADRGWLICVSFDVICVCDFASLAHNKGDAGWLILVSCP